MRLMLYRKIGFSLVFNLLLFICKAQNTGMDLVKSFAVSIPHLNNVQLVDSFFSSITDDTVRQFKVYTHAPILDNLRKRFKANKHYRVLSYVDAKAKDKKEISGDADNIFVIVQNRKCLAYFNINPDIRIRSACPAFKGDSIGFWL